MGDVAALSVVDIAAAPFAHLPATLTFEGVEFALKHEFHLTLLPRRAHTIADAGTCAEVERLLIRFQEDHGPSLADGLLDEWFHLREGADETLVMRLECPAHGDLRAVVSAAGLDLPEPWPHVTVYVAGGGGGIGVESPAELRQHLVRGPLEPHLLGLS